MRVLKRLKIRNILYGLGAGFLLLALLFLVRGRAEAQSTGSPLHPPFPLLDSDGRHVLETGNPVSTMKTCGACHDTEFIVNHSFHADVGLNAFGAAGSVENGRVWDTSPGAFGYWNPLTYGYLSPEGDDIIDLTTAAWMRQFGPRHVGGGPATLSRDGRPLTELDANSPLVETHIVDPETGQLVPWNWEESGVVEMNCFLCHLPKPDNEARAAALEAGQFSWANTATLVGTGVVENLDGQWRWDETAFDAQGNLLTVLVQDPTDENCAHCHGLAHVDAQTPLILDSCSPEQWSTVTTGQIISPQRLAKSGMNLAGKDDLSRSWDVHAERVVGCTDCHYALNNPVYYREGSETQPDHLTFDPRRIDLGEYIFRPLHQFAKGQSAHSALAPELDNTLRRCESCHSIEATHDWLPYKDRHMDAVSCQSCHIPKLYAPARQSIDWTVLTADGEAQSVCRGLAQEGETFGEALVTGFEPVWLPRLNDDGDSHLAPYNLIASWYWVYGQPARPVPYRYLEAAWLENGAYVEEVLVVFDDNGNGVLEESELVIDTDAKEALIARRLARQGLESPRIAGEIQPYGIHHDVAHGDWALRDCRTCHSEDSRITTPTRLSGNVPGDVMPAFVSDGSTALAGELQMSEAGELVYVPQTNGDNEVSNLYVLGHDSVYWVDWLGIVLFLGTWFGIVVHGGLRFFFARRQAPAQSRRQKVYMYGLYERLWHWLQTAVILGLIFTGLIIHKPDKFGIFSFNYVVQIHNVLAFILLANAALALFYHLVSGEIQQFLPRPRGFFSQAVEQALFYVRGIFKGEEHPFARTRRRKLNPLQQVTYFGLLNVLLPLQVLTGILMWGAQRWPELAVRSGGLPFLAPFHTLIAWLFASFVVMHVYLTTTGHTPLAGIQGMIMGWDEVEIHSTAAD
jgi:thiosulfate reductase cytochrome b subunit